MQGSMNERRDKNRVTQIMRGFSDTMVMDTDELDDKTVYLFKDINGFLYKVESFKTPNQVVKNY